MANGKNAKSGKKINKIFEFKFNLTPKNVFLWLIVLFLVFSVFLSFREGSKLFPEKPLSSVITDVDRGKISKIEVLDDKLLVSYKDGKIFSSRKENQDSIYKILKDSGIDTKKVEVDIKDTSGGAMWVNILSNVLPLVLMVGFFLFLIRQARGAQDSLFSFGQSKAKLFAKDTPKVTFADVAL